MIVGIALYFAITLSKEKSTPQTTLSDRQIDRFIEAGAIKLDNDMSNEEYLKMRNIYKADIRTNFIDTLTIEEQIIFIEIIRVLYVSIENKRESL